MTTSQILFRGELIFRQQKFDLSEMEGGTLVKAGVFSATEMTPEQADQPALDVTIGPWRITLEEFESPHPDYRGTLRGVKEDGEPYIAFQTGSSSDPTIAAQMTNSIIIGFRLTIPRSEW